MYFEKPDKFPKNFHKKILCVKIGFSFVTFDLKFILYWDEDNSPPSPPPVS